MSKHTQQGVMETPQVKNSLPSNKEETLSTLTTIYFPSCRFMAADLLIQWIEYIKYNINTYFCMIIYFHANHAYNGSSC